MALCYLETSALVKLYVREAGTDRMLELVDPATANQLCVLSLSKVELRSAIRRRERNGDIDKKVVDAVLDRFELHLQRLYLTKTLDDKVMDLAVRLVDRHNLKAYDALQLAGCLVLRGREKLLFVSSDHDLLKAARAEKLTIFDPSARN